MWIHSESWNKIWDDGRPRYQVNAMHGELSTPMYMFGMSLLWTQYTHVIVVNCGLLNNNHWHARFMIKNFQRSPSHEAFTEYQMIVFIATCSVHNNLLYLGNLYLHKITFHHKNVPAIDDQLCVLINANLFSSSGLILYRPLVDGTSDELRLLLQQMAQSNQLQCSLWSYH